MLVGLQRNSRSRKSLTLMLCSLGGFFGFLICVIMPVGFHLKMFHGQLPKRDVFVDWIYTAVAAVFAVVSTVWEFLPRDWMGL